MIDLKEIPTEVLERELAVRSMTLRQRREMLRAKLETLRTETEAAWVDAPYSGFDALRHHVIDVLDEVLPLAR